MDQHTDSKFNICDGQSQAMFNIEKGIPILTIMSGNAVTVDVMLK